MSRLSDIDNEALLWIKDRISDHCPDMLVETRAQIAKKALASFRIDREPLTQSLHDLRNFIRGACFGLRVELKPLE